MKTQTMFVLDPLIR